MEDGTRELYQLVGTEFEAFMDSGYNFQNGLMRLMHEMCPTLVPASIDDDSKNTLFKPVNKGRNDNDYGVLQMMVPHWVPGTGEYYEVAENVYLSFGFFGDEFSGFKKVNANAANRGLDDLNVANWLNGYELSQVAKFARTGYSGVPSMNMLEVSEDNIMVDKEKIEHDIDPKKDGKTHINVYSHAQTELGQFLSNFAHTPITLPEGRFESIEGYWHYLSLTDESGKNGIPADLNVPANDAARAQFRRERESLKKLYGADARRAGRALREKYGSSKRSDFKEKIDFAVTVKLFDYESEWLGSDLIYLPLEHYYVKGGQPIDQRKTFGWFTDLLEDKIDRLALDSNWTRGRIEYAHGYTERTLDESYGNVLALTGHRPQDLWGFGADPRYDMVYNDLAEYCEENHIDTIVSGMALGFDQIGAQVAIDNNLKLVAAVPMQGQENAWNDESKQRYNWLLSNADKIVYVSDGEYQPYKMQLRNVWMVNNADSVYALYNDSKEKGGTANCVSYALRRGKTVEVKNPGDYKKE